MALVYTIQSAALDAGASASAPLAVIKPAKAASTKSTSKAKTEKLKQPSTLKDTKDK